MFCSDLTGCGEGPAANSWMWQACTDVPLQASSNGQDDMFFSYSWNINDIGQWCAKRYGVTPLPQKFALMMGGLDIQN